jgi:hypothetical protein
MEWFFIWTIYRLEWPSGDKTMNAIRATWRNGQIIPEEPANWPEGVKLLVSQIDAPNGRVVRGMTEEEQGDTPEQIARWIADTDAIPALVLTQEEEQDLVAWREKTRQFNLEAVRRQMDEGLAP